MIMPHLVMFLVIMIVRPVFSGMIVFVHVFGLLVTVGVTVLVMVLMGVDMLVFMGVGLPVMIVRVLMAVGMFVLVLMLVLMVSFHRLSPLISIGFNHIIRTSSTFSNGG